MLETVARTVIQIEADTELWEFKHKVHILVHVIPFKMVLLNQADICSINKLVRLKYSVRRGQAHSESYVIPINLFRS